MANDIPPRRKRPSGGRHAGPGSGPEGLREFVVDRIAEKLDATADEVVRRAGKAAKRAETLDRISAHLGALDVWTRVEPASRRPRFTREDIAHAATRIADTEGFPAVSMRRIAAELGAGTMTLYHYVRTKDELLTLVTDTVMAEVVVPPDEGLPAYWRDAMTLLATRSRDALLRHPWILDITDDPAIGPNSVRHFDQSLQAVAALPVGLRDKLDIVATVDEYVFGYCLQERNNVQPGDAEVDADMVEYVEALLRTGDYPHLD